MAGAHHQAGDSRFFGRTGPHGLAVVAEAARAGLAGDGADRHLRGVAPLQAAGPDELSFIDNRKYLDTLAATRAGAVIVHPDLAARVPPGTAALVTSEPYVGWARAAALFHPPPPVRPGVQRQRVHGGAA